MGLLYAKKLILAKLEGTAGTKETLAAADAILATNVEPTLLAGDTVNRELEFPYFGASADIPVGTHMGLSFRVELSASGTAGKAPAWAPLLEACAFEGKEDSGKSWTYTPISADIKTLSMSLNIDGQLQEMHGARGTVSIQGGVNQIPYLVFAFLGLYNAPSSVKAVDGVTSGFKLPLVGSNTNTPTFEFHGVTDMGLSEFSLDMANAYAYRELIGLKPEVPITNRDASGSITIDTPKYSAFNPVTKAVAGDTGAFKLVHGKKAGQIITIEAPKTQISSVAESEADGVWQRQLGFKLLPKGATGNDEISIKCT